MAHYEFYVMSAAAVVGAAAWFYRKGRVALAWVRRVRRAFDPVRLDPHSTLDAVGCRKLAVGAMYASQQGAFQNTLETGIPDILPQIVGGWWGIAGTEQACETLDYLCDKGFRYYYPFVLEAFACLDPERQDEVFQRCMTSQEDYDKAVAQLRNLEETYDELVACGIVASKEDLGRYGVAGWDAGRICFLARACYEMGYLTEAEAWDYIDRADALSREAFGSWRELATSYLIGRSLWGGKRSYNSGMKQTADKLLADPRSLWVRFDW